MEKTLKFFGNSCAYTGKKTKGLVQDHVVPINRKGCGLHIYGNIIPASKEANSAKAGKTLDEFF